MLPSKRIAMLDDEAIEDDVEVVDEIDDDGEDILTFLGEMWDFDACVSEVKMMP